MASQTLGQRIKNYREKHSLDLATLAERTGLDREFLGAVEEEDVYPSLGPLLKIARALGVRLGTFLDDQSGQDPLIVRLGERQEQMVTHRGQQAAGKNVFYSLGRGKVDRHMEPFFVELFPQAEQDSALSSHEGEEFIVVQSGRVELTYGQDRFELGQGDSIYYNSVVPHHLACLGDEPAGIYAVLYFPE